MPAHTRRIWKYCNTEYKVEIIFASGSPRRRVLCRKIKYITRECDDGAHSLSNTATSDMARFTPVFTAVDAEEKILDGALATAEYNARLKGERAAELYPGKIIMAFDTVVGIGDKVFGKPKDRRDAISMFETLCGNTHEVVTAVYLRVKEKIIVKSEKTYITFGAFDKNLVYNYVDSGAPFDKAGGYNIDDPEIKPLVKRVDGDYTNVVGLPVSMTEKLIEENLVYGEDGYSA